MNWIHHKKILQRGYGEFGLVLGLFNNAMIFWLLVRDLFVVRRAFILIVPVFGLLVLSCLYLLGVLYERKLIRGEYHWETARNEPFMELMKDVKDIKKTLGHSAGQSGCGGCGDSGNLSCVGVKLSDEDKRCVSRPGDAIEINTEVSCGGHPSGILSGPKGDKKE